MSSIDPRPLLTVAEAAVHLKVHEKTIRAMIREGRLKASRLRGTGDGTRSRVRIRPDDIEALLSDSATG
jgi:excisionase family DNA binding protein